MHTIRIRKLHHISNNDNCTDQSVQKCLVFRNFEFSKIIGLAPFEIPFFRYLKNLKLHAQCAISFYSHRISAFIVYSKLVAVRFNCACPLQTALLSRGVLV